MNNTSREKSILMTVLTACIVAGGPAQAATYTMYGVRSAFLDDLGGAPLLEQDFESFADGTDMAGVAILPGVTVSTNLENTEVFQGSGDKELFSFYRDQIDAYYDINVVGHQTLGFDIDGFDPAAEGGWLDVFFADGDSATDIPYLPLNETENDPLFFGVISDTEITRIRWSEGPELDGSCCEETGFDNFVVSAVPIPAALPLLGSALAGLGLAGYRRRG